MKTIKISLSCMLIAYVSVAQNITNTLGTGGLFSLRDNSTTFLTLNQANGSLSLNKDLILQNTTNSETGVIYKGADRFVHDYAPPGSNGNNIFIGVNSGNFTMTAPNSYSSSYNTAVGWNTLMFNTTGYYNTALGFACLRANSTGYFNTAIGVNALINNTTGHHNTAIGYSLLSNIDGIENIAIGYDALFYSYSGNFNTAIGNYSLFTNMSGYKNTSVGYYSLYANSTGFRNTALGSKSLFSNNSGFQNTAVGDSALYLNNGNYNTALGFNAGSQVTTGANLTLIGIDANPSSPTAIDQITLGNIWVSSLRCNVQTITSLSDARDKKNIADLSLGLDFITRLKPRQFNWDKRDWYEDKVSDGSKMENKLTAGFIAQELDEVQTAENADWLNLVLKDNPDKLEATYGNLLPVMVKAIQELNDANEKLKIKNDELQERLSIYEKMQNVLVKNLEQINSKMNDFKEIKSVEK